MIRVFVVDDHAVLREGLRLLLSTEPTMHLVGEANNGQELLAQLPTIPADVVLLDMNMPVLDGLDTARQLRARYPQLRILMLSMLEKPHHIGDALAAGAHGYVLKNANKHEVIRGIHTVLSGKRFVCAEIGLSLLNLLLTKQAGAAVPTKSENPLLSRREHEVLRLVTEGLTTQQIADQLFASRRTIETHRQNILAKTGCKNTAALVSWASTQRLL